MTRRIPLILFALALASSGCIPAHVALVTPTAAPPAAATKLAEAHAALHKAGDPDAARRLASEVLKLDPASAPAHRLLLLLAKLRDQQDDAFRHGMAAISDTRNRLVGLDLQLLIPVARGQKRLERLVQLVELISQEHPDPQARADALGVLVQLHLDRGNLSAARATLERRQLARRFMGIGTFDNKEGKGFDTPHPPESEIKLKKRYPALRTQASWRQVQLPGPVPVVELGENFYPLFGTVIYLVTWVTSPADRDAMLELSVDDPTKVWLNDRQLLALRQVRRMSARQLRIPVRLNKGANKLLIKYCVGSGRAGFNASFTDAQGQPLALTYSDQVAPHTPDRRPPLKWSADLALPPGVGKLPPGPNRAFMKSLALSFAGLYPAAISALDRHLEANPRDPVALMMGVILYRTEGQMQQATRLIEKGVELPGAHAARFWLERVRLYRKRMQYDKALEALARARELSPKGLGVLREEEALASARGWNLDRCKLGRKAHKRFPTWAWPAGVMASCMGGLGRPVEARRWRQRALRRAGLNMGARESRMRDLLAQGRCREAIALQRATLRIWPGRHRTWLRLGDAHRSCGQGERAAEAYRQASRGLPTWHLPHKKLGLVHYEAGRVAEALASWKEALRLNPEDTRLWDRVTHLRPEQDPVLERHRPRAEEIAALIAQRKKVKPVEGASIAWLLDDDVTYLMEDGTVKRLITTVRMAVDRTGRDRLGEQALPRSGMVKVLDAYSINPEGKRQEVTSMHGDKVRYPGLREGSVVVLQYRHTERPRGFLSHHLTNNWLFQHNLEQVLKARWVLALPASRKLSVRRQGELLKHEQRMEGGLAVHEFSARDVPPLRPEPGAPPPADLLTMVTVSTVPSWDYFSKWGRSLTSEVFEINPALRRTLEGLIKGKATLKQKVDAIYHFALTRVRYQQDYETFLAGVKPHPASMVLARGYGDCKDKSVLIIAMLRHIGIKANLALIRVRGAGKVQPDVPMQQFNHAVVYLPPQPGLEGDKGRFLDATAENLEMEVLRQDVQGTLALVLFSDRYKLVPVPYQAPQMNLSAMKLDLELQADGSAAVTMGWTMRGKMAGTLRKPLQNKQILRQYAQGLVHNLYSSCTLVSSSAANTDTILKPLQLEVKAACTKAARVEGRELRLRLPRLFARVSNLARWSERRHPLLFGPGEMMTGVVSVKLPRGVTVKATPPPLKSVSPCHVSQGGWSAEGGGLAYKQTFLRQCNELNPDGYQAFRKSISELARNLEGEAVLAVGKANKKQKTRNKK